MSYLRKKQNRHSGSGIKRNLHVANILAYLASRYGGPPQAAVGLGRALHSYNIDVSYWATGNKNDASEIQQLKLNTNVYKPSWPKLWYYCPEVMDQVLKNTRNIDLLHIHEIWSYPQYIAAKIAKQKSIPYIITPHGNLDLWKLRKKARRYIYLSLIGKHMLQNSACIQAFTPHEVNNLRRIGHKGPITIIPNGINPKDFLNLPSYHSAEQIWPKLKNRRVVLFMSRLSEEKGLDVLIPAWKNIITHSSFKDAILVLAGPDYKGYVEVVKSMVANYNLDSNLIMAGMVTGRKKMSLMSRADVYILPSYSEGFSVSLLENLAAANPVIVTPACYFPKLISLGIGLCAPPEPESLAESMKTLLDMPVDKRKHIGQIGRNFVFQNYSWDIAARKMTTVYRHILAGKDVPLYPEPIQPNLITEDMKEQDG